MGLLLKHRLAVEVWVETYEADGDLLPPINEGVKAGVGEGLPVPASDPEGVREGEEDALLLGASLPV